MCQLRFFFYEKATNQNPNPLIMLTFESNYAVEFMNNFRHLTAIPITFLISGPEIGHYV